MEEVFLWKAEENDPASSSSTISSALKTDLRSTLLELVDFMEVEDMTAEHPRNAVSSLSSIHLIPADLQVSGVTWLKFFEA